MINSTSKTGISFLKGMTVQILPYYKPKYLEGILPFKLI